MKNALTDQVVLITGASMGIGEAVALKAAEQGAKLILAARREGVLQTVKEIVSKRGAEAIVVPTDVADPDQITTLVQTALDQFGRVDILVNNAGYGQWGPVEEVPDAAVRRQFEVNVFGLLNLTRSLIPVMRQQGSGRIINISSVVGQISMPFSGIYSASKHAVEAVSDALRVEVAPFGINVILIEPGPVATEFFQVAKDKASELLSPESPYQIFAEKLEDMTTSMASTAWSPERVSETILKAMTDSHPADRYTAFTGGKVALGLMRLTPAGLMDQFWSRWLGMENTSKA